MELRESMSDQFAVVQVGVEVEGVSSREGERDTVDLS